MQQKVVDKSVEECSENIDGNEMIYNDYDYERSIQFLRSIHSVYFHWYLKRNDNKKIILILLTLIPILKQ